MSKEEWASLKVAVFFFHTFTPGKNVNKANNFEYGSFRLCLIKGSMIR